jgi:hypothetical protein
MHLGKVVFPLYIPYRNSVHEFTIVEAVINLNGRVILISEVCWFCS